MSIADTIESMQTNLANAYDVVETKGGTLPANKNLENLANAIDSISAGGSSKLPQLVDGTVTELTAQDLEGISSIRTYAFYYLTSLQRITLPNTVTSIGNGAFIGCTSLTSVTLPNTITTLGQGCFQGCTALTSFIIPSSVTAIGGSVFYNCTSLSSLTISKNVTSIGTSAFYNCDNIRDVYFDGTIAEFQAKNWDLGTDKYTAHCTDGDLVVNNTMLVTFTDNTTQEVKVNATMSDAWWTRLVNGKTKTDVVSAVIPSKVTSIGANSTSNNNGFAGCTALTSVTIPSSVTAIGGRAFYGCTALTTITLPNTVTSIGNGAFIGCTGLISVTLPTSLTILNQYVFSECTSLTSVTMPTALTTINQYAFGDCSSLLSITIPPNVTTISGYAFYNCTGLTEINYNATSCNMASFAFTNAGTSGNGITVNVGANVTAISNMFYDGGYPNTNNIKTLVFAQNSVCTTIGNNSFYNCSNLTSVTIPENITSLGRYAFYGCTGLTEINFNATNLGSINQTDYVFDNAGTSGNGITVNVGANVTRIPSGLFGQHAMNITSVVFAQNSACTEIAGSAFYQTNETVNPNLTSLTIPSSVTAIGYNAFYLVRRTLTEITILAITPPTLTGGPIFNTTYIPTIYIPAGTLSAYQSANIWKNYKNNFVELSA